MLAASTKARGEMRHDGADFRLKLVFSFRAINREAKDNAMLLGAQR